MSSNPDKPRYPSLKDVAKRAGVSFQTTSKVLNGGAVRVSAETAERIAAAAQELGYSRNVLASSLVRSSSTTIGVVLGSLQDPALALFAYGVETAARANGHSMLVVNVVGNDDGADAVRTLLERRVDGIVAAAPPLEEDIEVAELLRSHVPCVSLHHIPGGGIPVVGSNMREVADLAVGHLIDQDRRLIGTVTGPMRRRVVRSRLRGAEERMRERGVLAGLDLLAEADWTADGAATATRLLLELEPKLDGLFVHSDMMAVGALHALEQAGRRVPDDVAVVSCDDLPFAAHLSPPLSTVRLPFLDSGASAVDLLLKAMHGEEVETAPVLLPVELIVRESSGAADASSRAGSSGASSPNGHAPDPGPAR